ncbi:Tyrosine kinase receptor Cad96Ca [Stylophora pistillata]|uniref:receptor protein-tyrosine kinase n=2 Tax=Stylophora pistillata TaxID=50429 RepID=A0A2B4SPV6_STYPI|nr:Tyrosine kinase receptor Cad96Ca [Stylophora pistillata]
MAGTDATSEASGITTREGKNVTLPYATSEASGITTREGKNVTLPCKTSNGQSGIWYKTVWFKGLDRVIFIGNGGHFIIYSQRKHPITVVDKESIRLDYVDRYDHGNYSCRALYLDGSDLKNVQQNVTLLVKARPLISTKSPRIQNLTHNASKPNLALDCTVNAFPKADATWQKIDGQLPKSRIKQESNGTLVIHEASAEDSGTYQCSAVNELGRDQLNFTVAVFEPPRIFGKKKFHANVDETAELISRPESPTIISVETTDREALVTWTFNDDGGLELNALILQYRKGEQEWNEIQIKPPNKNKYTIMYLDPDTNYNFRILATNNLGTSTPSSNYFAKTKKTESNTDAHTNKGFAALTENMTALVGGVGGGFLAIMLGIIAIFCFFKKMHKNNTPGNTPSNSRPTSQQEPAEMTALLGHTIPNIPQPQPNVEQGASVTQLSNNPWEFPRNRVDLQLVLGSGAFGVVMKAQAQGIKGCVGKMYVAVKIVKESDSETARRDLLAELELLKLIEPHPNVIGLLGCCTRQEPLMVIVEFCAYGDLQSYLRHCRGVEDKYYQDLYKVPIEKLGSRDLLSFAIQTARGMAHLAAMKVVHRDLAARNVLIDEHKVCKVADFGFARDIYVENHYTRKTQGGRFPIKWMAIESLLDGVSTTKSDVWSFGVVLWEIVTLGASPYPGMNSQEVINFLQESYRMDRPKHCSEDLYILMMDCWQVAPQRRPTFVELSQHLSKMFSDEKEYIDMRMYEDHLYINFDKASGTLTSKSGSTQNPCESPL